MKFKIIVVSLCSLLIILWLSRTSEYWNKIQVSSAGMQLDKSRFSETAESKIIDLGNGIKIEFIRIPSGEFVMGSRTSGTDESPERRIRISRGFYLGKLEVTQEQWCSVMSVNLSSSRGDKKPAENLSFEACQEFIRILNLRNLGVFRLPSEAEWEYACRAGTSTEYYWGDTLEEEYLWSSENSQSQSHQTGLKKPNRIGLYDMSGNVWEWCQDWYAPYPGAAETDPKGPHSGSYRVLRGGSYSDAGTCCRAAFRNGYAPTDWFPNTGMRLCLCDEL
ncbi:MAG: formylglycine-generating enzyme family protein [Candidatus Wallbacteria bacterium]|nr:formylglycine-generating enzyme family protein [Candidatus Wallbacteria bacterium]